MKSYKVNEADAVFSESINITETTDTNHADNINAAPKEIFENTVALNREVKTIKKNMEEESGESIGYNNESSGLMAMRTTTTLPMSTASARISQTHTTGHRFSSGSMRKERLSVSQ